MYNKFEEAQKAITAGSEKVKADCKEVETILKSLGLWTL